MRGFSFNSKSISLNKKTIRNYDAVVIATDHDSFDYEIIKNYAKLIIDTRGRFSPSEKIIRA